MFRWRESNTVIITELSEGLNEKGVGKAYYKAFNVIQ